ncbi:thiamine phosphate synthase [Paraburkholderia caballeronis]|uniref:thiamine phosphate synthase n=1 Tax=Paraburkholderia caballeronis TaxID=416943 RepID=UPI00106645A8|nr:thiamine phosphate synthase [Paraburkholderia caballeronis]TDV05651.1 thiamine-phosphate diphosphorylase [Paraburkholderia caballeronis]TDV09392.1 thiamine-phosphate diphosphorylase [Paraburkholderia caballeronis]TDV20421.1 thiamine-phosphate diphosphorylase [Paraburkholderia caballeronis]TDV28533.1 thiamine-phosphate diphosphorylase [Paraburkholderia caballeronis]
MTGKLTLKNRELFWPPADELTEAAERIRARLGDWPPTHAPWRLCLTPPDEPNGGDLIVVTDAGPHLANIARWMTAGAGVIEAADDAGGGRATLHLGGERYALEGQLAEDWVAALAAFLDCGFAPHDALVLALAWRDGDETRTADAWPVDFARFPRAAGLPDAPAQPFAPCPPKLGLYPVLPTADWVERVLDYGVKTVQLRSKQPKSPALAREIERCVAAGRRHDAQVFINDHWREAIDAGAYGVHLGQEDVRDADLGAIAAAGVRLGLSTHGYYEMLVALHFRPSYLALGAVFATTTKVMPTEPQGLARLARYVKLLDGVVPLVAIGGVDGGVLPDVLATGVGCAAVVRAVTEAADPAAAVAALQRAFTQ